MNWKRSGRRLMYVNGIGYNIMWIVNDIKDYEYHVLFEVHSFDMHTLADIEQLVPHTTITMPSDYCELEIVAQIMQYIRKHYRHLCPYVCINN